MAYPTNTSKICQFLGHNPETDFIVSDNAGVISFSWIAGGIEPTEQEIIDAGNDLTTINGQTFSQWYAENGGDLIATAKKVARDLQDSDAAQDRALRAVVKLMVDELNFLRQWVTTFKSETAAATNLANFQSRIANNTPNLADRTYPQAKTAINDLINGE